MTPQESFVTRLRRYRQRQCITVEEVAEATNVRPELFQALENNDLSGWPRGLYARSLVRTYALAVDLDPLDTVDEFCRLFPHGDRRAQPTLEDLAHIVAHPSEYRQEVGPDHERRRSPAINMLPEPSGQVALLMAVLAPCRALWARIATLAPALSTRHKRQPHTSL